MSERLPQLILLMGDPGAGKTTVARRLSDHLLAEHDDLTVIYQEASEIALRNSEYLGKNPAGIQVNPKVDLAIMTNILNRCTRVGPNGVVVVSGYPRYIQQFMDVLWIADRRFKLLLVDVDRDRVECVMSQQASKGLDMDAAHDRVREQSALLQPIRSYVDTSPEITKVKIANGCDLDLQDVTEQLYYVARRHYHLTRD